MAAMPRVCASVCVHMLVYISSLARPLGSNPARNASCEQLAVTKLVSVDVSPPVPGQTGSKPWGKAL